MMDNRLEIERFMARLLKANKSPSTARLYRIALESYESFLLANLLPASTEAIETWLKSLETLGPATQRTYYSALRSYYRFVKSRICKDVEYSFRSATANQTKIFEIRALESILAWFRSRAVLHAGSYSHYRDEVVIKLAAVTGARISEILDLGADDIRIGEDEISILFRNTKTRQSRVFPILVKSEDRALRIVALSNQATLEMIRSYRITRKSFCAEKGIASGLMFLSNKGSGLSYGQIYKVFGECLADMKIPGGSIHWLRHTWITQKLEEGAPAGGVSALVGHASPAITMRVYAHASSRMLRSITYNNLFQKETR